jgi:hypothetical protein
MLMTPIHKQNNRASMKTLNLNWLTDGIVDVEYKKYILLAYLTAIKTEFAEKKLYPAFTDLIFHYQNLVELKNNKQLLHEQFPQRISKTDFHKLELLYKKIVEDDETMKIIEEIVYFSLPLFNEALSNGKEIYEYFAQNIEITPVGITPVYTDEGYALLNEHTRRETKVYRYQITIFENIREKYRGINMEYVETVPFSLANTYENIKGNLTKKYSILPNPATFVVVAKVPCPFENSLLPIAKRSLVQYVTKLSA